MECELGSLTAEVNRAIAEAEVAAIVNRIWQRDASVWKSDVASQKLIANSLGWLTVADEMSGVANELTEFANSIRAHGFTHVMVCGMGGSSLCPEVLAQTFGQQPGYPELLVLDSTDPDVLAALRERINIRTCLFIIASKSGSTTEPTVFQKFWYDEATKSLENPGDNFIAITDPGSPLETTAKELNFRRVFLNQSDIGGRYSALSYFGMVPAALAGIDVRKLLEGAKKMSEECSAAKAETNDALLLGVTLGECANLGRDKLTLVIDPKIKSLGLWIEQLVAESTGKEGKGILPVAGEDLGAPDVYGNDRLFVSIELGDLDTTTRLKLKALADANHPVVYHKLNNTYDLGGEFFSWEFATACAGWRLGINPFDQPNVQEAKDATKELLAAFVSEGKLPEQRPLVKDNNLTLFADDTVSQSLPSDSLKNAVSAYLSLVGPNDYVAFLDYVEETPGIEATFQTIRMLLRDRLKCATTTGYGPRFLHSTGQLHKGGPATGVFFQITADDEIDLPVPGEPYSFSVLKQAQALGDFRALSKRGRRAVRIHLGGELRKSLNTLKDLFDEVLR